MKFRILMASGSRLWKKASKTAAAPLSAGVENSLIWKRVHTTLVSHGRGRSTDVETCFADLRNNNMASLPETGDASASASVPTQTEASRRREMYKTFLVLTETGSTIAESLNQLMSKDSVSITRADLLRWSKLLRKDKKNQHALEIFDWMESQKMTLSPSQHGTRVDLIAKTKGLAAAENYFNSLHPCAKNQSTYRKLLKWYCRKLKEDKAKALYQEMDQLKFLNSCSPFNDVMIMYVGLRQPEKVYDVVREMHRRDIPLNLVSHALWLKSSEDDNDSIYEVLGSVTSNFTPDKFHTTVELMEFGLIECHTDLHTPPPPWWETVKHK